MKKLTTASIAARSLCAAAKTPYGAKFSIEWSKSRMWGANPILRWNGIRAHSPISGCGYDKESACLADVLRWLFDEDDPRHNEIWGCGGCGFDSLQTRVADCGFSLVKTASGNMFDAYSLSSAPITTKDGVMTQIVGDRYRTKQAPSGEWGYWKYPPVVTNTRE